MDSPWFPGGHSCIKQTWNFFLPSADSNLCFNTLIQSSSDTICNFGKWLTTLTTYHPSERHSSGIRVVSDVVAETGRSVLVLIWHYSLVIITAHRPIIQRYFWSRHRSTSTYCGHKRQDFLSYLIPLLSVYPMHRLLQRVCLHYLNLILW